MRHGRVAVAALYLTSAVAGASLAFVLRSSAAPDATNDAVPAAVHRYYAGVDRQLALDYGGAYQAYREALLNDPEFLPPLAGLMQIFAGGTPEFVIQFLDSLTVRQTDPGLRACFQTLVSALRGRYETPQAVSGASVRARTCDEFVRRIAHARPGPTTEKTTRLLWPHRDVPIVTGLLLGLMTSDETPQSERLRELSAFQRNGVHPLSRALAYAYEATVRHKHGDESAARAAEARARADPAFSLGGFRAVFYEHMTGHENLFGVGDKATPDSLVQHERDMLEESVSGWRRVSREGDQLARLKEGASVANWLLDRGRLTDAVSEWTSLVATADSVGDPALRAITNMKLGRALVKTGRLADAERHLLLSRALQADGGSVHTHKETEHNLLHLYETLGRHTDARRAGEGFVRFASLAGLHQVRMMSSRDFARFLRSRGELEESRRYFARMLADVDSLGDSYHWAGEYYELSGEIDKAREYYARALKAPGSDVIRVHEALARISVAAGDSQAAIRFAKLHDQRRTSQGLPESAPILPGILRRLGRPNEARSQLDDARGLLEASSQVAASASIMLELAELELSQANHARARALADSAALAAHTVGAVDISVRASALAALAAIHLGTNDVRARKAFDRAVHDADRLGHIELRGEIRRRRADGLALLGDWRRALAHYAEAAVLTDSVAERIALDPQQASFRAAQRAVYDGALAAIVAHANEPGAPARYVEWSRRRKGRGYASTGIAASHSLPNVSSGRALVDYVVLDSAVAALVVTASRATLIRLPVRAHAVRDAVRRLHTSMAARLGSAIDLSRVSFPLAIAHELYRQLIAPIEGLLYGVQELTIVPDGPLYLVPFDALVSQLPPAGSTQPYVDARYLLDRFVITESVASDAATLNWRLPKGKLVAVAPETEGALGDESRREVAAIARLASVADYHVLRGADATERAVREAASRSAILHIAAHASVNHHDPASSRVALVTGAGDDGALHPDEITQLELRGSLVVLSACETAAGRVLDGEGVLSLSRSFLRGGAAATIATLWPVGPRSADFMGVFYEPLLRGAPPAHALRAAKLTMREGGTSPFFWAPYTLIARRTA